jgi:galactose-1-phosphate uridylyltransferase
MEQQRIVAMFIDQSDKIVAMLWSLIVQAQLHYTCSSMHPHLNILHIPLCPARYGEEEQQQIQKVLHSPIFREYSKKKRTTHINIASIFQKLFEFLKKYFLTEADSFAVFYVKECLFLSFVAVT